MAEIFSLVLATSLYASVVGLVIILLKAILKNKINAFWHYFIWVVLVLKLLIPFGPESAFSLFNCVPVQIAQPEAEGHASQIEQEYERTGMSVQTVKDAPSETMVHISETGAAPEDLLPWMWALGTMFLLLCLLITNYLLHIKLSKNSLTTDERIKSIFENCKKKMGVKTNIEIMLQNIIATPSLYGIIRPKILLTPAISNLSDKDLEYILLHELAHYKRKDVYVNYLLLVFQTAHWFNPVLWYCFRRLRQDMEAATDEKVLGILENTEHKEYGMALLAVLEGFNSSKLTPRLLGMADDRKNIERRIKMIKMAGFYKNKRGLVMAIGILSVAILSGVLLTNGTNTDTGDRITDINSAILAGYDGGALLKYKSPYIGDASNVANLLSTLPLGEYKRGISLDTEKKPYGLTVNYDLTQHNKLDIDLLNKVFLPNTFIMFSLIDNLSVIRYNIKEDNSSYNYSYTRDTLQIYFDKDLRDYSKGKKEFEEFLSLIVTSGWKSSVASKYLLGAGASLNNIKQIRIEYFQSDNYKKVQTANSNLIAGLINDLDKLKLMPLSQKRAVRNMSNGVYLVINTGEEDNYFYIDYSTGGISRHMPAMSSLPVYIYSFENTEKLKSLIHLFVLSVNNHTSGASPSETIDQAVSKAILSKKSSYAPGEAATEGHIILDTDENDGLVTVYTISSFGAFGFENGIFTKISGSGAIPTVITFTKNKNGEYSLLEYREPMDGAGYTDSIKRMFPSKLLDKVLSADKYPDLKKQQEEQAKLYLQSIGRNAQVSASHVEKMLININVEASNRLFSEMPKYNPSLANFPYWQGTREQVEDEVRYIYETSQSKTGDGYDLILFKKKKENGTIVEEYRYKIVGGDPQLIS